MNDKYLKKAARLLMTKPFEEVSHTNKQKREIARVFQYIDLHGYNDVIKKHTLSTSAPKMIEHGVSDLYLERLRKTRRLNKTGITLYKCLLLYGRAGYDVWNNYREKQAHSNSIEYKKHKHGMTEEEYDQYNQTRASTRKNFIKRHGEEEGARLWDEYRRTQQKAGVTLEHFVEKYGEEEGTRIFDEVRLKKTHSVDGVLARQPELTYEQAVDVVTNILSKNKSIGYSRKSQALFWEIYNKLNLKQKESCYFAELNKEFGKFDHTHRCYRKYDFVLTCCKIVIEFNGDYFHAKPGKYKPDDVFFFSTETASDIWEKDRHKQALVENEGYKMVVVWESDYDENPDNIIQRCLDEITAMQ